MAEITKYQKYKIVRIHRSMINKAYYNPRFISDENSDNLKKIIKREGLIEAIVWNVQTGNLVGGHQRLNQIDMLEGHNDYDLEVCQIDVSIEKEVELNLILNNTSLQGENDKEKLKQLKNEFPMLDFSRVGYTKQDIKYFDLEMFEEKEKKEYKVEQFENYKKSFDEHKKNLIQQENINGNSIHHPERNDKCVTIVLTSNNQKWDFMRSAGLKETDKFVNYDDIIHVFKEEFRF